MSSCPGLWWGEGNICRDRWQKTLHLILASDGSALQPATLGFRQVILSLRQIGPRKKVKTVWVFWERIWYCSTYESRNFFCLSKVLDVLYQIVPLLQLSRSSAGSLLAFSHNSHIYIVFPIDRSSSTHIWKLIIHSEPSDYGRFSSYLDSILSNLFASSVWFFSGNSL